MPHLNPGQGQHYQDEPGMQHMDPSGAYYDPYRGPTPTSMLHDPHDPAAYPDGGEAYPMQQMRGQSPGPHSIYDAQGPHHDDMAYGRRGSPAPPQGDYGRGSPAPQVGRMSPGPRQAYAGDYGVR